LAAAASSLRGSMLLCDVPVCGWVRRQQGLCV
jgi:hypothetical protein